MSPPGVDLEMIMAAYDEDGVNPSETSINIVATTRNLGSEIARSAFFNHTSQQIHIAPAAKADWSISAQSNMAMLILRQISIKPTFAQTLIDIFCYSDETQIYIYEDDFYFKHKRMKR